VILISTKGVK